MATRRRCSVCHRVGHDKRAHGRIRRPAVRASGRRNPTDRGWDLKIVRGVWRAVAHRGRGYGAYPTERAARDDAALFNRAAVRRVNPKNPDFYRDTFGRAHPVRGTPDYEDGFVGMSRADKRYLKSGSDQARGGYTQELPGRDARAAAARLRRRHKRGRGKTDTGAYERLTSGRTRAQKEADANRRRRVFG